MMWEKLMKWGKQSFVHLEESKYKFSYSFESNNGQKDVMDFVEKLCAHIFYNNLIMLMNPCEMGREFPLGYVERQAYSSIAHAIGQITPYHMSEMSYVKDGRRVDFWCQYHKNGTVMDMWIEHKALFCNMGKRGKKVLIKDNKNKIKKTLEQIESFTDTLETSSKKLRIAFWSVPLHYRYNQKPQELDMDEAEEEAKKIQQHIKEQYNWHADSRCTTAYSILNLCSTIEHEKNADLKTLIKENPYQIFLEKGRNYKNSKKDLSDVFVPFVILFAAIKDFSIKIS